MARKYFDVSNIIFKAMCGTTAFFMVGFWALKFYRNEDVSAIEYISFDSLKDIAHPELSICLTRPYIYQILFSYSDANVSVDEYDVYLHGRTKFLTEYTKIDFNNVTLNLIEYFEYVELLMRNGTSVMCKSLESCPYVRFKNSFNGFISRLISRCFGFSIILKNAGDVEAIYLSFKPALIPMLEKIRHNKYGSAILLLNYPGQIVQNIGLFETIWKTPNDSVGIFSIKATSMEILRRRYKNSDPCFIDWMRLDDAILERHHDVVGCSPPYHRSGKSVCRTNAEIKNSVYEMRELGTKYYTAPCEEMSHIAFKANKLQGSDWTESLLFYFEYPLKTKVIHQTRSVDLHSLVGNIGGYIGLFLGN